MSEPEAPRDPSVLHRMEESGLSAPRVHLRGSTGAGGARRFRIYEELSRRGVVTVFSGRDVDLGRRVALMVLDEDQAENPEVVKRFVEEAQIGGQLQHPGIVPVYELGLIEDGRPFYATRLVRGRALSELLADRNDPAEGRHALLQAFEQVCRTMAYAHSRGVVNRNLRAEIVRIGEFGETAIVDWGEARVLKHGGVEDERRSRETSVGDPDDGMDERCDVCALGSMLTEILTGSPPGDDPKEVVARLEECGAEKELTDLAASCVSPALDERPRDAEAVARAVAAHLAAVEERAHRFEVEAAEARADAVKAEREIAEQAAAAARAKRRAEEERTRAAQLRRTKRQTLLLAASIVLVLVIGGSAHAWFRAQRLRRAETAALKMDEAVEEARSLMGRREWPAAFAAAEKAEQIAASEEAEEVDRERVRGLLADLTAQRSEASERDAHKLADERMEGLIQAIRLNRAAQWDSRSMDSAFVAAFREYGIDILTLDPEEAAKRIRASVLRSDLVAALDDWGRTRRAMADWEDGTPHERLLEIAGRADGDETRGALRAAILADEFGKIEEIARESSIDDLPPETVRMLGQVLSRNRDLQVEFLYRAQVRDPGDLTIRVSLAVALAAHRPPRTEEALRHAATALSLAPRKAGVWALYGYIAAASMKVTEAIAAYRKAISLDPGFPWVHSALAGALRFQGDHREADRALRRQVAVCESSLAEDPGDWVKRLSAAMAHVQLGELDAAEGLVEGDPGESEATSRDLMLGHLAKARGDLRAATDAYRNEVARGARLSLVATQFILGTALLQQGEFEAAEEAFRGAAPGLPLAQAGLAEAGKLAGLEPDLEAIAGGERAPEDAAEALLFARLCFYRGRFAAAARLYGLSGDGRSSTFFIGNVYHAGVAAALAVANGQLEGEAATAAREQAAKWLRVALAAKSARITLLTTMSAPGFELTLPSWFVFRRDLAGLRDGGDALSRLPEPEQAAWRELMTELDGLLPPPPVKEPR